MNEKIVFKVDKINKIECCMNVHEFNIGDKFSFGKCTKIETKNNSRVTTEVEDAVFELIKIDTYYILKNKELDCVRYLNYNQMKHLKKITDITSNIQDKKYRKLPVVVDAFQFKNDVLSTELPVWFIEAVKKGIVFYKKESSDSNTEKFGVYIKTLEGDMEVSHDDYIIKGVNDEIYPCKPDIFEKTYEEVDVSEKPSKNLIDYNEFVKRFIDGMDKLTMEKIVMSFGTALICAQTGKKIAREGWNGKNMFVYYVSAGKFESYTEIGKSIADKDNKVNYNPYLAIKNSNGTVSTWVPSINDCLAEDWYVVK